MHVNWFAGLSTEEKEKFTQQMNAARPIIERLNKMLQDKINSSESDLYQEVDPYKVQTYIGRIKALREMRQLVTLKEING